MYTAEFSEFSYGYALTDNLLHSNWPSQAKAPVFPSLISEGRSGGYDVKIPFRPVALFLQFKIPQVMLRRSDLMPAHFNPPYLRMHLRTDKSNQHELLRKLATKRELVYYATPLFWTAEDLDRNFASRRVAQKSLFLHPIHIGQLNNERHHIAYDESGSQKVVCSEPRLYEGGGAFENLFSDVSNAINSAEPQNTTDFLNEIVTDIDTTTQLPLDEADWRLDQKKLPETNIDYSSEFALIKVAGLVQMKLGCLLGITGREADAGI